MWPKIYRASNRLLLRQQALSTTLRNCHAPESRIAGCYHKDKASFFEHTPEKSHRPFSKGFSSPAKDNWPFFIGKHRFSSQADTKSSGEENVVLGVNEEHASDDDLISEGEFSNEDSESVVEQPEDDMESLNGKKMLVENNAERRKDKSEFTKAFIASPGLPVDKVMKNWIDGGGEVTREDISFVMTYLRRRKMYARAFKLSEWLELSKQIEFLERDYASRVDLIAKLRGLNKAENYINNIPESFRGEVVYRSLLANCVSSGNEKKAEEVFNKIKDKFQISTYSCDQMLRLYKRIDKKKIADILLLMKKQDIKPSAYTYSLLIETKGRTNDIPGMEQVAEAMKADGIQADFFIQSRMARSYIFWKLKEKSKVILEEMEGSDLKKNRGACKYLLTLYASLGNAADVERVWKACESADPSLEEFTAAIEAWGKLKKIQEAEDVFDKMRKRYKKLSPKRLSVMLKVYADNKMLLKGKNLVKQMEVPARIDPLTWDALVKLYVEAGEVEKADSILEKATKQLKIKKPMFRSYMSIMQHYAKRGDIPNAEKIFQKMQEVGHSPGFLQFRTLMRAYLVAKTPAYGMWDRLKANNIYLNRELAGQLHQLEAFKKAAVPDLLK